jgi:hypothetical protein
MSTKDSLVQEIMNQPESVLREVQHYLAFLIELENRSDTGNALVSTWPDRYFEATAGAFENESFERPAQLAFERRQDW